MKLEDMGDKSKTLASKRFNENTLAELLAYKMGFQSRIPTEARTLNGVEQMTVREVIDSLKSLKQAQDVLYLLNVIEEDYQEGIRIQMMSQAVR